MVVFRSQIVKVGLDAVVLGFGSADSNKGGRICVQSESKHCRKYLTQGPKI